MLLLQQMPLQSWSQPHELPVAGETLPGEATELEPGGGFSRPAAHGPLAATRQRLSLCQECIFPHPPSAVPSRFHLFQ